MRYRPLGWRGKSTLLGALLRIITVEQGKLALAGARTSPHAAPGARPMDDCCFRTNKPVPPSASCRMSAALGLRAPTCGPLYAAPNNPRRRCGLHGSVYGVWQHANLAKLRGAAKPCGAGRVSGTGAARWCYWMNPFAALGPALRNDMLDLVGQSWPQKPAQR